MQTFSFKRLEWTCASHCAHSTLQTRSCQILFADGTRSHMLPTAARRHRSAGSRLVSSLGAVGCLRVLLAASMLLLEGRRETHHVKFAQEVDVVQERAQ